MNSGVHLLFFKRIIIFFFFFFSKIKILDLFVFFFPIKPIKKKKKGINILALSSHRFESDIKELDKCENISIFTISIFWQSFINFLSNLDSHEYPYKNSKVLQIFLIKLKNIKNIKVVISGSFWYRFDIPIGNKFDEIGVPYTIIHKECFKYNVNQHKATIQRFRRNKCNASYYLLHNEVIKKVLVMDVPKEKIDVLGNMRMDEIFKNRETTGKDLSFFLFPQIIGLDDWVVDDIAKRKFKGGWKKLFRNTTKCILKFAEENQEININVKGKDNNEISYFKKICDTLGYKNLDKIKNLKLSFNENAQDIILRSKLIISFGSTVILEAAVLGREIIIPNFDECSKSDYKKRIKLINDYKLFIIANTENQLYELIKKSFFRISCRKKENLYMKEKLFRKWIDPLDGKTRQRYYNKIIKIAEGCSK